MTSKEKSHQHEDIAEKLIPLLGVVQLTAMVVWLTADAETTAGFVGVPPNVDTCTDGELVVLPKSL